MSEFDGGGGVLYSVFILMFLTQPADRVRDFHF